MQNEGSKSACEFVNCLQFTNWQGVRLHQQLKMLLIHQSMRDKIININTIIILTYSFDVYQKLNFSYGTLSVLFEQRRVGNDLCV